MEPFMTLVEFLEDFGIDVGVAFVLVLVCLLATVKAARYGITFSLVRNIVLYSLGCAILYMMGLLYVPPYVVHTGIFLLSAIGVGFVFFPLTRKIKELESKTNEQQDVNTKLRKLYHNVNARLKSLERGVMQRSLDAMFGSNEGFGSTLYGMMDDIEKLSEEVDEGIRAIPMKSPLESTGISSLDDLFGYFWEKCFRADINFQLNVLGGILQMVEDAIPCDQLEKLISNHIENAITAIQSGKSRYKSIFVTVGMSGESYVFTVMDSGVHFAVKTLEKLGEEKVTTSPNQEAHGFGFMTTFEILKEHNASIVINERDEYGEGFTKSVAVCFDSANRYVIKTYRRAEFSKGKRYKLLAN
jgi:signal transduction histidine kinase